MQEEDVRLVHYMAFAIYSVVHQQRATRWSNYIYVFFYFTFCVVTCPVDPRIWVW